MVIKLPTRILFVITGLSVGGAEMMLLKLLERIDRSRFDVAVISLTTMGEIGLRIADLNIKVTALSMRPSSPNPLLFFRLLSFMRRFKPDIVHTWMYHADLLGGMAARLAGVKKILWSIHHSDLSVNNNKKLTLAVVKFCARLSSIIPEQVLACSHRAREIHVKIGYSSNKMVVVPNGFDLQRFVPNYAARLSVRQELGLPPTVKLVGLIGRFHIQKNHLGFIEAAALIYKENPNVNFLLAGDNIDRENVDLSSAIANTGLSQQMHLLGRRSDIPRLMAALDVLASSSLGEAFPNVLGEAMACGVPCVVTDVGDSAAVVGNTGRVVAMGDMTAFAKQILEILSLAEAEKDKLGIAARQRVANNYEIGKIVNEYQKIYVDMLRK
ncbi:hypothetical protein TI04_02280 [Achromatium sp. WMS2]|nr:hypothetical protein TI04_02280 [Achromatium sp. WMS2]